MKIRNRLWGAFGVLSLLLALVGAIAVNSNWKITRSFEGGKEHFRSLMVNAIYLSNEAKEAESFILAFLIEGDPVYRSEFLKMEEALRQHLSFLDQRAKIPEARAIINDLKQSVQRLSSTAAVLLDAYDQVERGGGVFTSQKFAKELRALNDASAALTG